MQRNIEFSTGEFYHIYSRGVEKRTIFLDNLDHIRFMRSLFLCNSTKSVVIRDIPKERTYEYERDESLVDILTYCLMPNHFHILIHEKKEGGISVFMKKLLTSYSMYFNSKYKRSGSLFGSAFKATHANKDEYLKYLFAYIHLNPVKLVDPLWKENGISNKLIAETYLNNYSYSSFQDFIRNNSRKEGNILNLENSPEYFNKIHSFKDYVDEWLLFDKL